MLWGCGGVSERLTPVAELTLTVFCHVFVLAKLAHPYVLCASRAAFSFLSGTLQ